MYYGDEEENKSIEKTYDISKFMVTTKSVFVWKWDKVDGKL